MLKKGRIPCLMLLVPLVCCLCLAAACFLLVYINPIGFLSSLTEKGGLRPIDSYPTAPPRDAHATILFSDDFSNPNSGWRIGEWSNGRADYQDGGYRFEVSPDNNMKSYIYPSLPLDISIEVDVSVKSSSTTNDSGFFGVICRYQDNNGENYDEFTFGGDTFGLYPSAYPSIMTFIDGGFPLDQAGEYPNAFLFPADWGETYHIRADCIGDQMSLYVNGYLVQRELRANHATGRGIGLMAGHVTMSPMQYVFDNLVVYKP